MLRFGFSGFGRVFLFVLGRVLEGLGFDGLEIRI